MLYIFDDIDGLDDGFPEQHISFLSEERRIKAFSYRFPLDRKLSVAVYLLLRLALIEKYGIDEPVVFSYGNNGKPFLRDYPHINYNISHCRSAAACVIADDSVGVDVQEIAPVPDGLAQHVLSADEYAGYRDSRNPEDFFCAIWTIKESWLKRTGQGIGTDLKTLPVQGMKTLYRGKDYYCCVNGADVQLHRVSSFGIFWEYRHESVFSGTF